MARHNEIGELGEIATANFLKKNGFEIVNRNYRKKWGELDIVAKKKDKIHFVEVKTVTRHSIDGKFPEIKNDYKPEDNMHPWKVKRLQRAIQTFILEKLNGDPEWQFDLACVYLDPVNKVAKIVYSENIILC